MPGRKSIAVIAADTLIAIYRAATIAIEVEANDFRLVEKRRS